eukprot:11189646-Lingulodinium_polyedra.AAC.1
MQPAYVCMAWMMKHCGVSASCSPDEPDQPGQSVGRKSHNKPEVMFTFVNPATSPVIAALALGAQLAQDRSKWPALWAFNRGPESDLIVAVWQAVLPALSILAVRVLDTIRGWPLQLMLLLGPDSGLADIVAEQFSAARLCCIPKGLRVLRSKVTCAQDCKQPWFIAVVRELAWQCDLANYDKEIDHSKMRSLLNLANGKSYGFGLATMLHFAADIGKHHRHECPDPPARARGRPAQPGPKKRQRYDAWNAF